MAADRERLAALIDLVLTRWLDRPTMVALDFDNRPLGEAVESLAARTGFTLALDDPGPGRPASHLAGTGPLPFWLALDRLGRTASVRHDPEIRADGRGNFPVVSIIRLVAGDPPPFTSYYGPLRIHLFTTHRHRDVNFDATGPSRLLSEPPSSRSISRRLPSPACLSTPMVCRAPGGHRPKRPADSTAIGRLRR